MTPKTRNDLIDIASNLAGIDQHWIENASQKALASALYALRQEARTIMDSYNSEIVAVWNDHARHS
jgi:hypothetical protein